MKRQFIAILDQVPNDPVKVFSFGYLFLCFLVGKINVLIFTNIIYLVDILV
jgi:hypothetical protein